MHERPVAPAPAHPDQLQKSRPRPVKAFWKSIRGPLGRSRFVRQSLASGIALAVRFIDLTNRRVEGSHDAEAAVARLAPAIGALWHGQHLMAPIAKPKRFPLAALFSRSADAELNALAAEKLGLTVIRGSGGRTGAHHIDKGGVKALIAMKKMLDSGTSVVMIADIPHGTPRDAGLGIVTLAKLSGRPIVPIAVATSRRKVLESTWDKTTINLPFGRCALLLGDPISVPADADTDALETYRQLVTSKLNETTAEAYRLVDAAA
ncbi:MAG: lysophospholipid acyltransferase family protein [Mesorhizobium sp.]|nr:lysophospholipid acyltransferase family protein [Mesorhizobium sp.]